MSLGLIPHPGLRSGAAGTIFIGGAPITVLRLSPGGARLVASWFAGAPVSETTAHQELAARLVQRNMATVAFPDQPSAQSTSLAVVIPVKDDAAGLTATLERLQGSNIGVVVVDDGSQPALALHADANVTVIDHERSRGPASARNTGLRHPIVQSAEFVAFIDAGVEIDPGDLERLTERLDTDPTLAIVAPRVRSKPGSSLIDRYERAASPLDLGTISSRVTPGSAVSYVPSACLVARRSVLDEAGGFDSELRFGEDVDLVWRLASQGHHIDYVASIEATHPPRTSLSDLVRQRVGYGSAAAPLGVRHGDAVTPWRANGWSAGIAALFIAGQLLPAAMIAAIAGERLAKHLPTQLPDRRAHAHRMALTGHVQTVLGLGGAAVRPWWPFTVAAFVLGPRRVRRAAGLLTAIGRLAPLISHNRSSVEVSTPVALVLGALDDASYGLGVWKGAGRERSVTALLPAKPHKR